MSNVSYVDFKKKVRITKNEYIRLCSEKESKSLIDRMKEKITKDKIA